MLFKHECNLQTPGSLLCEAAQAFSWHLEVTFSLASHHVRVWRNPFTIPTSLSFIHPSCWKRWQVSLTSIILSSVIPKMPVTLALANEPCIYFSCKVQGFSIPFFVPHLLKEGFLSWILSLHPSRKCGICFQCQRKAFSSISVSWRHKDMFSLSTMSHFLISFTLARIQVSWRNYTI